MPTKDKEIVSNYTGSEKTYESVKAQIAERIGEEAAESYDPYTNCLTFRAWLERGYVVKKGSKSFSSVVVVEKKDKKGKVVSKYAKRIALFHESQVKPVEN